MLFSFSPPGDLRVEYSKVTFRKIETSAGRLVLSRYHLPSFDILDLCLDLP
jgi:hypothetical protein